MESQSSDLTSGVDQRLRAISRDIRELRFNRIPSDWVSTSLSPRQSLVARLLASELSGAETHGQHSEGFYFRASPLVR